MSDVMIPERYTKQYSFVTSCQCFECEKHRPLYEELGAAEAALSEAQQALGREEEAHLVTIDQRDAFEDFVGNLAADLGCKKEWSSMHDHRECVEEIALSLKAQVAKQAEEIRRLSEFEWMYKELCK
jgi:hypothetical protein